jgi:hypothetical protein
MRKFLLASAATLGTGGLMVAAFAQAPTAAVGAPLQDQMAYPMANPLPSVLLTPKIPAICDEFGYAASLVRTSALAFRAAINAVTTMRPRSER